MPGMYPMLPAPRKRAKYLARACLVSLACFAGPVLYAQENLAVKTLTEQARFWEGKGRADLAAAAWQRLLQIQPQNPDALAGLAKFELENNRPQAAQALTETLKKDPVANQEAIKRVEEESAARALNSDTLEKARASAKVGKLDEAVGFYKQLFADRQPTGAVALEYYQTLGGTANGWEDARQGLERLRTASPGNNAVALALAQHLTYREPSRREGIKRLTELTRKSDVSRGATAAWRSALLWLDAGPADVPLFQAYLKAQPDDEAVRSRLATLGKSQKATAAAKVSRPDGLAQGFAALNAGDVTGAEQHFEKQLSANPKNGEALGGLGVVRLRQERFAEAENLLTSATRASGGKKWTGSLNTARFWLAMQEGQAATQQGQSDQAVEAYRRALKLDPNADAAKEALMGALVNMDQLEQAQALVDAMPDGEKRRDAARLLVKRKASKALEAKDYAETERLLAMPQAAPLDSEAKELMAWAAYHQGKLAEAAKGFTEAYRHSPTVGAASGLVFSFHKQKAYKELLALARDAKGPVLDLLSASVQQKIEAGETRFDVDAKAQLVEVDPINILTEDVLWPATLALLREKNPKKAYDLLLPVEGKLAEIGDYGMMVVLGEAATQLGDETTAIRTLKKAATETDDETYYFTLARSLITFGHDREAESIMLKQVDTLDADGLTLLGWTHSRLGKPELAAERFAAAHAKEPTAEAAQALVYSSVQSKKFPLLLAALDKHPNGPLNELVSPEVRKRIAAGDYRLGVEANARVVALSTGVTEAERGGFTLKLEPRLRSKAGVAGEGKLRQGSLVATLTWQGETHRASLEVERQHATDWAERVEGQRWYAKWGMKMTPHIGVELGVGRTLSGALVRQATVGEAGVNYVVPDGNVGLRLFRRVNDESLLALAGTLDANTGIRWGRVLESGALLSAYHKPDRWENLGYLVVSRLDEGQGVADNRKFQFYARTMWYLDSVPGLGLGADLGVSRFSRNLSGFQPGHGGYFSPSSALTVGAVGKYTTRLGDLDLLLLGGVGWSYDRVDAEAGDPINGTNPGRYPATTGRALVYHGRVQGLKPLDPNWSLGFGLGRQKGSGYSDWNANVFVQRSWLD